LCICEINVRLILSQIGADAESGSVISNAGFAGSAVKGHTSCCRTSEIASTNIENCYGTVKT